MIIDGKFNQYEIVIGLELHVQLKTKSKLFSSSSNIPLADQNTNINPVDFGMPGMLPVFNSKALEYAVKIGIALNSKIAEHLMFDRKNYFYPDLPQGYQISQFYHPIVQGGSVQIELNDNIKVINIHEAHLEQDAGKLIHGDNNSSYADYNRVGIPLIEIVSQPDMRTPEEAMEFIKKIRSILRTLDVSTADMEAGSLRCDANISVMPIGSKEFGTRCEVKNMNSIKFVGIAIEKEAKRQVEEIESGNTIHQETRLFDQRTMETRSMRKKENASDYRYFPEMDLFPFDIKPEYINKIRQNIPELPDEKFLRYKGYDLSVDDSRMISMEPIYSKYFDEVLKDGVNPKMISSWLLTELLGKINKKGETLESCKVLPSQLAKLISLIESNVISGKIAKDVLDEMIETGIDPNEIIDKRGLKQISNVDEIKDIVISIIENFPSQCEDYKSGNKRLLGFFIGEVMKKTKGSANPTVVNTIIKELLD